MSYGCFNRPSLAGVVRVQSGYKFSGHNSRADNMVLIKNPMTKDCQYQKDDKYNDPGCVGCAHKEAISPQPL